MLIRGGDARPVTAGETAVPTAADMHELGRRLAAVLRAGDLVVLSGPLGAGKTTLVQGIGDGLGVRGPVTSPTFVIARVHPALGGGPGLVHVDAYRLASVAEVDDLDLDASLDDCVTVVEWGEGLVEGLAADRLEVEHRAEPGGRGPRFANGRYRRNWPALGVRCAIRVLWPTRNPQGHIVSLVPALLRPACPSRAGVRQCVPRRS